MESTRNEGIVAVGNADFDPAGPRRQQLDERVPGMVDMDNAVMPLADYAPGLEKDSEGMFEPRQVEHPRAFLFQQVFDQARFGAVDHEIKGDFGVVHPHEVVVKQNADTSTSQSLHGVKYAQRFWSSIGGFHGLWQSILLEKTQLFSIF